MFNFREWITEAGLHTTPVAKSLFVPAKNFDERSRARKFLRWLSGLGIDVQKYIDSMEGGKPVEIPVHFSGGNVGTAFPMGNMVVKITGDEKEAKYASRMIGHSEPGVAKIYDVVKLPGDIEVGSIIKKLYAIVQEKLPVGAPKRVRMAGDLVYKYLDNFAQPLEDVDAAYKFIIKNYLPEKRASWHSDEDLKKQIMHLLVQIKSMQDKYGFTYRDTHGGNLLVKNRKPALFDLGQSTPVAGNFHPLPRDLK